MKKAAKLGFLVLVASLFMIGAVGAVSEWKLGDTVQLIVTTTNMGDVDVVRSTGTIYIRDPRDIVFTCDVFDVEGVVHPGEAVKVPVSWNTGFINATLVPGYYDIILDGELAYANGEYEETHSEVPDAFLLYLGSTGLRELPEIEYVADISGITQLSDTYYPGSTFMIIVWVNNTGSSLFIPEIQVSFTCDEDYTFEPEPQCYYDDVCTPGSNPYMYQCQLPEDMPAGTCEYDVDLQMYCIDVEVTDENYPDGLAGFWYDYYVISEVGSGPEDEVYKFSPMDERGVMIEESGWSGDYFGYYDIGMYLEDAGYWPDDALGYGYCFQWFNNGDQIIPDPNMEKFCEESEFEDTMYRFYIDDVATETPEDDVPWEWTPTFGEEGYHNVLVELRERSTTDIGASDLVAVFVERLIEDPEEPVPLYVWLTNECDYAFLPEFTLTIPEIDDAPVITLYGDDVENIAPPGQSVYKLDVDVSDIPPSEEGYYFELSVEPTEIYIMELDEDDLDIADDTLYYRFFRDNEAFLSEGETFDERLTEQWDSNYKWTWTVPDEAWESLGSHTIYVEVSDDLGNPDFTGDSDRIGIASLEVTVTEDDSEPEVGTDDGTEGTEGEGSTEDTGDTDDTGSTTGSETDGEESEEETGGGGIGEAVQSFIDQILEILRGIFG